MNPFESIAETAYGYYVFYNNITNQYCTEPNLDPNDYRMFMHSPSWEFIGFFKSTIQAEDTIEACKKYDKDNPPIKYRKKNTPPATLPKKKSSHNNTNTIYDAFSGLEPVNEYESGDQIITEYYIDDIDTLPEPIKSMFLKGENISYDEQGNSYIEYIEPNDISNDEPRSDMKLTDFEKELICEIEYNEEHLQKALKKINKLEKQITKLKNKNEGK